MITATTTATIAAATTASTAAAATATTAATADFVATWVSQKFLLRCQTVANLNL